jgi:hypothetical protein
MNLEEIRRDAEGNIDWGYGPSIRTARALLALLDAIEEWEKLWPASTRTVMEWAAALLAEREKQP